MAVTKNSNYAKSISINRLHGIDRDVWQRSSGGGWEYDVVDNGNKYNSTDINAALGLSQLEKLEWMNDKRMKIAQKYDRAFEGKVEALIQNKDRETSNHLYQIKVSNRDALYKKLKEKGIGTSVHFTPIHKLSFYKEQFAYSNEKFPVANDVFSKALSLPIYPDLTNDDVNYIIENVLNYSR